jgi:SAM-dependent methyltransferase
MAPGPAMTDLDAQDREREFHDALARELDPAAMPPRGPDALEQALLAGLGDLTGKRVLDLGCGIGDLSLQLLGRGAHVTGLDLSPGMVAVTGGRAARFMPAAPFTGLVAPVENTGLEDDAFDLIVGKWILHHIELDAAFAELRRILRPGGQAAFIENSAFNPLLMVARRHLAGRFGVPRYGTADEHPLTEADVERFRGAFPSLRLEFPDFAFFRLFDRQILRFRHPRASRAFRWLDETIYERAPRLRRYSFHVVVRFDG